MKLDLYSQAILEFSCHRRQNNLGTYWRNLGFLEVRKSHETILILVNTCVVSGKFNINHYYG